MAVAEIKQKFGALTTMTCTLASLASSTSYVGRQTTLVNNTATRFERVLVYFKIKLGTSPTGSRNIYFHLLRSADGSAIEGGAGASDAAYTALPHVRVVCVAPNKSSPSTGDVIEGVFVIDAPGPYWALAVSHDTGVALDATGGNHSLKFVGINPEAQLPE